MRGVRALVISSWLCVPHQASAQNPAPQNASASVDVRYEWHRDHLRYSFDNRSSFDTATPVPHNYTQTYWVNNHWVVARVRFSLGGTAFTSELGATPPVTTRASDIDTFFNPNSDIITSGTDGQADMRSWRLAQWSHGRLGGVPLLVGYKFRRDTADFHPADIVVTRSNPPSLSRRFTMDEEYTASHVHEFAVSSSRPLAHRSHWQLHGTVGASPFVLARLSTRLPQKYPGRTIRSDARAAAFTARLEAVSSSTIPLVVGVEWGKSVSYRASRSLHRDALELSIGVRWP